MKFWNAIQFTKAERQQECEVWTEVWSPNIFKLTLSAQIGHLFALGRKSKATENVPQNFESLWTCQS